MLPIVDQEPLRGFASMYFAGEFFSSEIQESGLDEVDYLTQKGILVKESVSIDRYFKDQIRNRFSFEDNGFEFISLDQNIVEKLRAFTDIPYGADHSSLAELIDEKCRLMLTDWGKKKGISFDVVLPLHSPLYRHTMGGLKYNSGGRSTPVTEPFPVAHVDYCDEEFSGLLHENPLLEQELQKVLQDDSVSLTDFEVSEVVNLWIPLNERPTRNTLALMDTSTIQNRSEELKPYRVEGLRCSNVVKCKPYHRWVILENMTWEGVAFNTFKTAHAAIDIEKEIECDQFRHSLDMRYVFASIKETNAVL